MKRDIRSPATPVDFEATLSRAAVPPVDFSVRVAGDRLVVRVVERSVVAGRGGNTGYRIGYIGRSFLPTNRITPGQLLALGDLAETVAFLPALNNGGAQQQEVSGRTADAGFYLCCPVGQRGVVGPPAGLVRTPWGA